MKLFRDPKNILIGDKPLSTILVSHQNGYLKNRNEAYKANLSHLDLSGVSFLFEDLREIDFTGSDLSWADFRESSLNRANFTNCNLKNATFTGASVQDVICEENILNSCIPIVCPTEGSFIGWKEASGKYVKLLIPAAARRSSATTRKCRTDCAEVLGIFDECKNLLEDQVVSSSYDSDFKYLVGDMAYVSDFCENRWEECAEGIHFFLTFEEAVAYKK